MRPTVAVAAALCGILPAGWLLSGCGGSSASKVDPQVLLREAKASIDSSTSVHFSLTSQNARGSGIIVTGGQGDIARPDQLQGSFSVTAEGFPADVKVVAKGGVFLAQLPFQTKFSRTDPKTFGIGNPAQFLDRNTGLSNLLVTGTGAHSSGQKRLNGELLDYVTLTVPGKSIPLLPNSNPSQPVTMLAAIDPNSHQLRQITLTGPFTSSSDSTFVVTFTNYGEHVDITLPPT